MSQSGLTAARVKSTFEGVDHFPIHGLSHDDDAVLRAGQRQQVGGRGLRIEGIGEMGRQTQEMNPTIEHSLATSHFQIVERNRQAEIIQGLLEPAFEPNACFLSCRIRLFRKSRLRECFAPWHTPCPQCLKVLGAR